MRARILLVDDDHSIRESLSKVLRGQDYEVAPVADGLEAIRRFDATAIDLVLLDLKFNTTSGDGWDTFYRLSARNPLLPVIIITARPNQHKLAAVAGVGALLEKPLDMPVLLRIMEDLLAEPKETRMARACGMKSDCRHALPMAEEGRGFLHSTLRSRFPGSRPHGGLNE